VDEQALANADHMAILHAIWTAETSTARQRRYQELLAAALPPQYRQEPSHKAQWLWRTLREALAALGPVGGPDVRGMADAVLIHLRDTYPIETAWAPPWVGDQLRQARTGAREARLAALRITAEAVASLRRGERDRSAEQQALADSYHAMHDRYRQSETALAQTMNDRTEWEQATRHQRQLAVAADAELRRRHPGQHWSPLRSAEPEIEAVEDAAPASPRDIDEAISLIEDLVARHREFVDKLAERQTRMIPAEDPGHEHRRQTFPLCAAPRATPILQPPKPEMQPSPWTLQRLADREADWEAAD